MATATTADTSPDTGQQVSPRGRQREAQQPVTQQERNAANRLRAMVARDFERIQAAVGDLLVDRPRQIILSKGTGRHRWSSVSS